MQYLYLLIFILFMMLNLIIGLASSRSKKRRAAAQMASGETTITNVPDELSEQMQHTEPAESTLSPQTVESGVETFLEVEESKPMIDISTPFKKVKLSIEKNLLESEVEMRAVERRKEQDEVYQARDMYWHQNPEMNAWERIDRLTPLKRAILLSEILGSPKGLSEGRHSE